MVWGTTLAFNQQQPGEYQQDHEEDIGRSKCASYDDVILPPAELW